jgi:AcrR family transcriptional regulator
MPRTPAGARERDRESTQRLILDAARAQLIDVGFQGLGVNAVARRAGCDKQLIYRYFDGLDGLVTALGAEIAASLQQRLQPLSALGKPATYREFIERLALGLLQAFRDDPALQRIVAWELSDSGPLVRALTAARSVRLQAWMAATRGDLQAPPGVDAPACNAFLIAAIQQLALSATAVGEFAGMPLRSESDWERVRALVKRLVAAAYPATP